jgi:hypothetical protein
MVGAWATVRCLRCEGRGGSIGAGGRWSHCTLAEWRGRTRRRVHERGVGSRRGDGTAAAADNGVCSVRMWVRCWTAVRGADDDCSCAWAVSSARRGGSPPSRAINSAQGAEERRHRHRHRRRHRHRHRHARPPASVGSAEPRWSHSILQSACRAPASRCVRCPRRLSSRVRLDADAGGRRQGCSRHRHAVIHFRSLARAGAAQGASLGGC